MPDSGDGVAEGQAGFGVPRRAPGAAVCVEQSGSPEGCQGIHAQQDGCGAQDCPVGPLPLGLNTEVGAAVLEGDLDLPAPDEPPEDVDGIGGDVGAEECLGFEVAGRIAHQHPADRYRRAAVVPDGGVGGDVEDLGPVSVPVGHRDRAPGALRVGQPALEFGQARALDGLASAFPGLAFRGWGEQTGIESQTADHGHAGAHSRQQIKGGKGAVANHDDPAVGQPPANTEDGLPSPVGQPFVPMAAIGVVALRRRQHGQKWQGHGARRPRHRRQHHQAKPSQAAGLDEMLLAGAHRVTINASGRDLWSPSALNGVIDADHYRPVGDEAVKNHP